MNRWAILDRPLRGLFMKRSSESVPKSSGHLLRVLGVGFGLAVTIGGTIGMGILRTPGEVARQLPTPTLFIGIWIVGGIYALLGAISVAELGAMIPRSGGFYVFAHRALGNYAGFVVGWSDWLSTCATIAVISMVGAVLSIIAIYVLVNLALLRVQPLSQIAGENLAVGAAASVMFGAYGDTVIRLLAIVSMLSTINAYTLSGSRTLYAMSCDGLFSHHATRVNKGGTPTVTLFISTMVAVLFIISGTFEKVLAAIAFFFVAYYSMAFISVFVLRWREPDLPRPYRVWGYPWTTLIVTIGSIAFLAGAVAGDTKNSLWALGLLAISYPVYLITKWMGRRRLLP